MQRTARITEKPVLRHVEVVGMVTSGRGQATRDLLACEDEVSAIIGQPLYPGSLNLVLNRPLRLRESTAYTFDGQRRMLWRAWLGGTEVWAYRWRGCPLHIIEVISTIFLRERFQLNDGDDITFSVEKQWVGAIPIWQRLSWALFWARRENWHYSNRKYSGFYLMLSFVCRHPLRGGTMLLRKLIRRTPVLKALAQWSLRKLKKRQFSFSRTDTGHCADAQDFALKQIQNVLNFTKTSESIYSAQQFPAGYHTLRVNGTTLRGQRDPYIRLAQVPFNFAGKTVLDLGCNQGGMIHALAGQIRWGVGIDYDSRMINAANRIKQMTGANNTHFYTLDLDKDPLALICDFMPDQLADVCFLLSVCMWLKHWREVINFAQSKSSLMLFETNGTSSQQQQQLDYLRTKYKRLELISETSEDDAQQKNRKLLLLAEPILASAPTKARRSRGFFLRVRPLSEPRRPGYTQKQI